LRRSFDMNLLRGGFDSNLKWGCCRWFANTRISAATAQTN
jgi:hypothetical protein